MMFDFLKNRSEIPGWSRLPSNRMNELLDFILPHESSAVPFTTRLLDGRGIPDRRRLRSNVVLIERCDKIIRGAVLLSSDGIICPVLTPESVIEPLGDLIYKSSFSNKKYLTLMGESSACVRFEQLFRHRRKITIDYHHLTCASASVIPIVEEYIKTKKDPEFISGFDYKRAGQSDLNALMPLRKAYELEEVLLNPENFSEAQCRRRFLQTIEESIVYYAEKNGSPAATCCVSAAGIKWLQIGGVYTLPELRSNGLSAALMTEIAAEAVSMSKDLCLFVKKDNPPALKLYRNCGFINNGEFRITYLERR